MPAMPYTYMVKCADDTYYVGSTWQDVEARVWHHNTPDQGAMYTRHRRPVELVWSAWFDSMIEAFAFEKRVQGWSRKKREALIRGDYDALIELSRRKAVQERAAAERGSGERAQ
jgi:predicted GIY-YIG superfamily endonuclease